MGASFGPFVTYRPMGGLTSSHGEVLLVRSGGSVYVTRRLLPQVDRPYWRRFLRLSFCPLR